MKMLLIVLAHTALAFRLVAADPSLFTKPGPPATVAAAPTPDWTSKLSVSPFGSLSHTDFEGKGVWGAGADVGYHFNKTLSLHGALVGTDVNNWGNSAIDETSVLLRGNLLRFYEDRVSMYLLGSADRYWAGRCHDDGDWGFGMGGGVEYRLTDKFSIGADYRIRAKFEQRNDDQLRGFLNIKF